MDKDTGSHYTSHYMGSSSYAKGDGGGSYGDYHSMYHMDGKGKSHGNYGRGIEGKKKMPMSPKMAGDKKKKKANFMDKIKNAFTGGKKK